MNKKHILEKLQNGLISVSEAKELLNKIKGSEIERKKEFVFYKSEPYVQHHLVNGEPILLGVTFISIIIEEIREKWPDSKTLYLHNFTFEEPIRFNENDFVRLKVKFGQDEESQKFSIIYESNEYSNSVVVGKGEFSLDVQPADFSETFEDKVYERTFNTNEIYNLDEHTNIKHGDSLKTIAKAYCNRESVFSELVLKSQTSSYNNWYIHPAYLEAAIMSGLLQLKKEQLKAYVPIVIKKMIVSLNQTGKVKSSRAVLNVKNNNIINIDFTLKDKNIVLSAKGFIGLNINHEKTELNHSTNNEQNSVSLTNNNAIIQNDQDLGSHIREYIRQKLVGINSEVKITDQKNFMDMGLDSMQLLNLSQRIEEELKIELYPTLFFEYQNIIELADYFSESYSKEFSFLLPEKPDDKNSAHQIEQKIDTNLHNTSNLINDVISLKEDKDAIAIIGISGLMPRSESLDDFWNKLVSMEELIEEIPRDHFDFRPYYDSRKQQPDKLYCKSGSYINNVGGFDASFFDISPLEAQTIDPQLRKLLQVLYSTIDDAGYGNKIRGTKTGMFVGACFHDYLYEILRSGKRVSPYDGTGNASTMLSNYPSFIFDLQGPSLTVDTACSSSLVALHLGCTSILNGECDMAFVSGTNLLLSPWHYLYFCSSGILSSTGRCRSFDKRADGYVPGEAVITLMLKPLSKAKKDKDHIHAVIKGSAISHGGYTPALTAPSVKRETDVIVSAWKKAGINPADIGFIEAHAGGTQLGDPIEVNATKNAFSAMKAEGVNCAISSIKASIGHTEGSAGLAGITRAIYAMKNDLIPAMPEFKELNPAIKLEGSGLYINKEHVKWNRNGNKPHIAGVNSFGFGGAYAHVVIEEYLGEKQQIRKQNKPYIFAFSGRDKATLDSFIQKMTNHLIVNQHELENKIEKISYTLALGRKPWEERLAVIANSVYELIANLKEYLVNTYSSERVYRGSAKGSNAKQVLNDASMNEIAKSWTLGNDNILEQLFNDNIGIISLPTRDFKEENYQLDFEESYSRSKEHNRQKKFGLIQNVSIDNGKVTCNSVFDGQEYFLKEHLVYSDKILVGTAYIDIALNIIQQQNTDKPVGIKNIRWLTPYRFNASDNAVYSEYQASKNQITVSSNSNKTNHFTASYFDVDLSISKEKFNPENLQNKMSKVIEKRYVYERFKSLGLNLGSMFQSVERICYNDNEAISEIKFIENKENNLTVFPALMDGAFHTVSVFFHQKDYIYVPFGIENFISYKKLPAHFYVYAIKKETLNTSNYKCDLKLISDKGELLASVIGFTAKKIKPDNLRAEIPQDSIESNIYTFHLAGTWDEKQLVQYKNNSQEGDVMFISGPEILEAAELISQRTGIKKQSVYSVSNGNKFQVIPKNKFLVDFSNKECFDELVKTLQNENSNFSKIVFYFNNNEENTLYDNLENNLFTQFLPLFYFLQSLSGQNNPLKLYIAYNSPKSSPITNAIESLLKVGANENKNLEYCLINIIGSYSFKEDIIAITNEFSSNSKVVRYYKSKRYEKTLKEVEIQNKNSRLKQNGVYLITGGAGKIGLQIGQVLKNKYNARLILTGRTDLSLTAPIFPDGLKRGSIYIQADMSKREDVKNVITRSILEYGEINGIIHCAGIIDDSRIVDKNWTRVRNVLKAKIDSTLLLYEETSNVPLDLMVLFSSVSSIIGSFGQSDYAYANSFMDYFSESLNERKSHINKTVSINYPLWMHGGMQIDSELLKLFFKNFGLKPISNEEGIETFLNAVCQHEYSQLVLLKGVKQKILDFLEVKKSEIEPVMKKVEIKEEQTVISKIVEDISDLLKQLTGSHEVINKVDRIEKYNLNSLALVEYSNKINEKFEIELSPADFFSNPTILEIAENINENFKNEILKYYPLNNNISENKTLENNTDIKKPDFISESVLDFVVKDISELLSLLIGESQSVDRMQRIEKYSLNSLALVEYSNKINEKFGIELSPADFFSNPTILEIAENILSSFKETIEGYYSASGKSSHLLTENVISQSQDKLSVENYKQSVVAKEGFYKESEKLTFQSNNKSNSDIAVIGVDGNFPGSPTLEEFWDNIIKSKNLISEIPDDRWDWKAYQNIEKDFVKWGAFVSNIKEFDPQFFGISPREAEYMDPQQRWFLQIAWHTIENAGYSPVELSGSNMGVFVGCANFDYLQLINSSATSTEAFASIGNAHSVIANRVSYMLDLNGPSETIDTACSSSLVAVIRAIDSINSGRCKMALAGGINFITHPFLHMSFNSAGMLSEDGKCKTFDEKADGYVRGEGGGAILLKSMDEAIADNDNILCVIKSGSINHGGRSTSFTAPNPTAQASLIEDCYQKAGIDISSVEYIETHGTGTSLGDAVEIKGLKMAFSKMMKNSGSNAVKSYCGLSSIKTNIGHLEAASGIASLIKAVLAIQNQVLPPSINLNTINPNLGLIDSPFYVINKARKWEDNNHPRRAGISSFGFGGTNAHVLLEEHKKTEKIMGEESENYAFIYSAKTPEQLKEILNSQLIFLKNTNTETQQIKDYAYTLQTGRTAYKHRVAFLAKGKDKIKEKLQKIILNETAGEKDIFISSNQEVNTLAQILTGDAGSEFIRLLANNNDIYKICQLWVSGIEINWKLLYINSNVSKVQIPGYQFTKSEYWIKDNLDMPSIRNNSGINKSETVDKVLRGQLENSNEILTQTNFDKKERIKDQLRRWLSEITGTKTHFITDKTNFTDIGLDSILSMELIEYIQKHYKIKLYANEILLNPTVNKLSDYLLLEISEDIFNLDLTDCKEKKSKSEINTIKSKQKPILYVFSSPRSGSTLLKTMLMGHSKLFAPPELMLLPYKNLKEWDEKLDQRGWKFIKDGLYETIKVLKGCSVEEAKSEINGFVKNQTPISEVYEYLNELSGESIIVDKTPPYSEKLEYLKNAEKVTPNSYYIFLQRHPLSVMESLVRNRYNKLLGINKESWAFADEVWRISNQNILSFINTIPQNRVITIKYEELVKSPQKVISDLCSKIGIQFESDMLKPYEGDKMIKGLHHESLSIGDPNFLNHKKIEKDLANAWKLHLNKMGKLSSETIKLSNKIGYSLDSDSSFNETKEHELSIIQTNFCKNRQKPPKYIQVQAIDFKSDINIDKWQLAIQAISKKYPILSFKLSKNDKKFKMSHIPEDQISLKWIDVSKDNEKQKKTRFQQLQNELLKELSSLNGKSIGSLVVKDKGSSKIYLFTHFVIADGYSCKLIWDSFWSFYEQEIVNIKETDRSYFNYIDGSKKFLNTKDFSEQREFLLLHSKAGLNSEIPDKFKKGNKGLYKDQKIINISIDKPLDTVNIQRDHFSDIATALYTSLVKWTGKNNQVVSHRLSNRNTTFGNYINSVGCFATDIPIKLAVDQDFETTKKQFEKQFAEYSHLGLTYNIMTNKNELMPAGSVTYVRLNYQGKAFNDSGQYETYVINDSRQKINYSLDFVVREDQNNINCSIRYDDSYLSEDAIIQLANEWKTILEKQIEVKEEMMKNKK
ncbi:MAG: SDR family NAD(P)-dependent oxidoreductase [Bacteroidales bacterium]|nr:SDR family NAD(P)-dependent oxidoreductase [Bacteroidales bacterium]